MLLVSFAVQNHKANCLCLYFPSLEAFVNGFYAVASTDFSSIRPLQFRNDATPRFQNARTLFYIARVGCDLSELSSCPAFIQNTWTHAHEIPRGLATKLLSRTRGRLVHKVFFGAHLSSAFTLDSTIFKFQLICSMYFCALREISAHVHHADATL
jgi:hypothetical protein